MNYRPEYRHDWGGKTYYSHLSLTPLGEGEAGELLSFLMGDDASLNNLKALILERTDGTPFFIEEVVQTLTEESVLLGERGQYHIELTPRELHISPNVQGVLAARIDRLETHEKALLQELAIIGRAFPLSLVRKVVARSEDELYRLLSSLQAKEFLYEQPALTEVEYIFKHALTQEVAYGTVLQEQRKSLHEQTARAIETLYTANLDDHYSELAHHYTRSGNAEKAIEYLHLAGQQAVQRSAHEEAIQYLTEGLTLLSNLKDTNGRAQQELILKMTLSVPLMSTRGWGAPEVESLFNRARELCQQLGDTPQLFSVLAGLYMFHLAGRSSLKISHELAEQLLRLASDQEDSVERLVAHTMMAVSGFYEGDQLAARQEYDHSLNHYDSARHRFAGVSLIGMDLGVGILSHAALTLWLLGYPDQLSPDIS